MNEKYLVVFIEKVLERKGSELNFLPKVMIETVPCPTRKKGECRDRIVLHQSLPARQEWVILKMLLIEWCVFVVILNRLQHTIAKDLHSNNFSLQQYTLVASLLACLQNEWDRRDVCLHFGASAILLLCVCIASCACGCVC